MERARGARVNKLMRSCIIGIGLIPVALGVLAVIGILVGIVPWRIFDSPNELDAQWSPSPPQPLYLPWITGWLGWGLFLLCVGCTAWTIWLERDLEERVEPLALTALCLAVLGHAEGIYGAIVLTNSDPWPLNLIDVAIWILYASVGVGILAWVRLLLTKDPTRGRVFATCAILWSLSSAWIVNTFLVDRWDALDIEDGIELPLVWISSMYYSAGEDPWPEIQIFADGQLGDVSPEDVARSMPQMDGLPDGVLQIRADHRAPWLVVKQTIEAARAEGIWRVFFAARWEHPPALRRTGGYFTRLDYVPDPAITLHTLRVTADGAFLPGDLGRVDRTSMLEWLSELKGDWTEHSVIQIAPTDDATWGNVIKATSLVSFRDEFQPIQLGPLLVDWY